MRPDFSETIVIGGGVVGLTTAFILAQRGCNVTVLEARAFGQEASWAGGGILMPLYPWRYPDQLIPLLNRSIEALGKACAQLIQATGIDPQIYSCGMSINGLDGPEIEKARCWSRKSGWPIEVDQGNAKLSFPTASNIRNPRFLQALVVYLQSQKHVRLIENTPVISMQAPSSQKDSWQLKTPQGIYQSNQVICCAGAWSAKLLGSAGVDFSIQPAFGEMLLLQSEQYAHLGMVLEKEHYLVPRMDGYVLIGSTVKYQGFQKRLSYDGYQLLLDFACMKLGKGAQENVSAFWGGLRPDAGSSTPLIGPYPGSRGLWINTGHFRNGLVLAMGSALCLADMMALGYDQSCVCDNNFRLPAVSLEDTIVSDDLIEI